jgi:hypothetical protein
MTKTLDSYARAYYYRPTQSYLIALNDALSKLSIETALAELEAIKTYLPGWAGSVHDELSAILRDNPELSVDTLVRDV